MSNDLIYILEIGIATGFLLSFIASFIGFAIMKAFKLLKN